MVACRVSKYIRQDFLNYTLFLKFVTMNTKEVAVLAESVAGLHKRFDDLMNYNQRTNEEQRQRQEETLAQVRRINGSVANLATRVHDIEFIQENCPAAELRKDIEESRDEMQFWIFLGKYWKTIAIFLGIVIGLYSAITTIASNIKEEKIREAIEVVKPSGAPSEESEDYNAL